MRSYILPVPGSIVRCRECGCCYRSACTLGCAQMMHMICPDCVSQSLIVDPITAQFERRSDLCTIPDPEVPDHLVPLLCWWMFDDPEYDDAPANLVAGWFAEGAPPVEDRQPPLFALVEMPFGRANG